VRYLLIENEGELDRNALLLMGASTKRSDVSKIGMFGTGAKYAIAVLLAAGIDVEIRTTRNGEEKRFRFRTEEVRLRGQTFHQILLLEDQERNGTPLNFTTEMGGVNWTVEAALRELVSNAFDEPRPCVDVVEDLVTIPGKTRVYVQFTPAVKLFWHKFDRTFLFRRRPLEQGSDWAIYEPIDGIARVYRKGVLVWSGEEKGPTLDAAFDYNIDDISINEERQADQWSVRGRLGYLMNYLSVEAKRRVLEFVQRENTLEAACNVSWTLSRGQEWLRALGDRLVVTPSTYALLHEELADVDTMVVPEAWATELERLGAKTPKTILSSAKVKGYKIIPFDQLEPGERDRLNAAIGFLRKVKVEIPVDRLDVFESPNGDIVDGEYLKKEDRIAINRRVLKQNKRRTVEVLFHERMHQVSCELDKTRGFERALIDAWIDVAQELAGEWL